MAEIAYLSNFKEKQVVIEEFQKIIEKSQINTKKLEIPSFMVCPITDDFMDEPVIL